MCEEDSLVSVCVVRGGENFITRIADVEGNRDHFKTFLSRIMTQAS